MSRNRPIVASLLLQGRSRLQDLGKPLRMALQQLASGYPSRWLVTAVPGSHDVYPSPWPGKPLDGLLSLHIERHCAVCAASSWSTQTLELAATRYELDSSNTLPVTLDSCRISRAHRPPTTCRLG